MTEARHHPKPWWYRLAEKWFPERCREIPEAQDTTRIVLRQFAIIQRYFYLQQFASSEQENWLHSHQWHRMVALGLWGSYTERRLNITRRVRAPYLYTMAADVQHHVLDPTPGHTSLFIGFFRDDDLKRYMEYPGDNAEGTLEQRPWYVHIQKFVKRI